MQDKNAKKAISIFSILTIIGVVIGILNDGTGFYDWLKKNFVQEKGIVAEPMFYFYETEGDHCWVFPVLKIYEDNTFILDLLVEDGAVGRYRGSWEFLFYKYILVFEEAPYINEEDVGQGIELVEGRLEFDKEAEAFSMWGCLMKKRVKLDKDRFKDYNRLKDYDDPT